MNQEIERDPFRLIWACPPEYGLMPMLKIVARVREYEPRVNLRVLHSWNDGDVYIRKQIDKIPQENVEFLAWNSSGQIEREARSANIWCCSAITENPPYLPSLDLMRFGCIPVFRSTAALRKIVHHGFPIPGDPRDPLAKCRYAAIIRDLVGNPDICEQVRADMIPWATEQFDQLTGGSTCS